jgi:hypothetical protein
MFLCKATVAALLALAYTASSVQAKFLVRGEHIGLEEAIQIGVMRDGQLQWRAGQEMSEHGQEFKIRLTSIGTGDQFGRVVTVCAPFLVSGIYYHQ